MKIQLLTALGIFAFVSVLSTPVRAQSTKDSLAIQAILTEETNAWNNADAKGYSNHFAADGNFTNILGAFYQGHEEFMNRHAIIFKGPFRGTTVSQTPFAFQFISKDIAVVQSLSTVSGFSADGPPKGSTLDDKGHLHTKLLQIFKRDGKDWKIIIYHNIDVKPGIPINE